MAVEARRFPNDDHFRIQCATVYSTSPSPFGRSNRSMAFPPARTERAVHRSSPALVLTENTSLCAISFAECSIREQLIRVVGCLDKVVSRGNRGPKNGHKTAIIARRDVMVRRKKARDETFYGVPKEGISMRPAGMLS